ncbi:MAG: DUF3093 family protein [Streptosporangiales bacterium]|nr:DUF3093 family protein [Streptosporangiales bacterium]
MATQPDEAAGFAERLWVPWWWWPVAGVTVAILGAEVHLGLGPLAAVLTYLVLGATTAALLVRWAFPVRVDRDTLAVGTHRVELARVTGVTVIERTEARRALADHPDATAVVLLRGYARHAVFVTTDGAAGAPGYLLFSTRRPDEVAAALDEPSAAAR